LLAEQNNADHAGAVLRLVGNALIPGREKLCCFPEPAYIGTALRDGRPGSRCAVARRG
jgi:hypothetical protein